jgi:hypothetical protein
LAAISTASKRLSLGIWRWCSGWQYERANAMTDVLRLDDIFVRFEPWR